MVLSSLSVACSWLYVKVSNVVETELKSNPDHIFGLGLSYCERTRQVVGIRIRLGRDSNPGRNRYGLIPRIGNKYEKYYNLLTYMKAIDFAKKYLKYTLFYIFTLVVITAIYVAANATIHFSLETEKVILAVTSPFNSGYEMQYVNNIEFTFLELLFVEIYFTFKNRKYLLKWGFVSAILASYITAVLYIMVSTSPSAGSSIVALSILIITFVALMYDLMRSVIFWWNNKQKNYLVNFGKIILYFIFAMIIPLYAWGAFFMVVAVGKISYALHEIGILIFFIFFCIFVCFGIRR